MQHVFALELRAVVATSLGPARIDTSSRPGRGTLAKNFDRNSGKPLSNIAADEHWRNSRCVAGACSLKSQQITARFSHVGYAGARPKPESGFHQVPALASQCARVPKLPRFR